MQNLYLFYVIHHLLKHSHLLGHHLLLCLYQISKQYFGFVSVQALLYNSPYPQKQPPQVFCKKRCTYKFRKILRKTPGAACNLIKKEALAQVFSCEFCEISKNTFFSEHLQTTASVSISNFLFKNSKVS